MKTVTLIFERTIRETARREVEVFDAVWSTLATRPETMDLWATYTMAPLVPPEAWVRDATPIDSGWHVAWTASPTKESDDLRDGSGDA